jgi:hypothetical protein
MRVAYLINNVVEEIREINRPIADYPQVHLVEAGAEVAIGFTYDGTVFTPHATHQAEVDKAAQDKINREAKQYLASTDWKLLRELDGGVAMTVEMKTLRAAARLAVVE